MVRRGATRLWKIQKFEKSWKKPKGGTLKLARVTGTDLV